MTRSMKSNRFVPYLLTCIMMLLAGVCASAQNISLSFKDAPLAEVLHAMEEQTECSFIYEMSDLSKAPKVTVNAVDRTLSSVLDEIIKAPLGYEMKGKIVKLHVTYVDEKGVDTAPEVYLCEDHRERDGIVTEF